jgi:hypothetical protein
LTSLLSRVYSQQVFLDKFTFSCVQSTSFPWQVYLLVCTVNKFPWQVYFLVCTVNNFSLTSLPSRVYSQQVFLDKFTFSCVQSTSFPSQVYLLVCTVNKFSLTSLLSRVYSQQAFLDKFTFSCVRSTSFPWQVFLDKICCSCARNVVKHLSRVKAAFCLPKTTEVFLVHLSSFPWRPHTRTNFPCPKAGMSSFGTRLLDKEKRSIFYPTHKQIKLVKEKLLYLMDGLTCLIRIMFNAVFLWSFTKWD